MLRSALFAFCSIVVVYIQHVKTCGTDEYECDNGRCTRQSYVCDMENNCGDWSDERNCLCSSDQFQCANGRCTPLRWKCDGYNHCGDGSDELNCNYSQSCVSGVRQCRIEYYQSYGSLPSSRYPQQFVDALREIPLETHCSLGGDFMQCKTALEEECSSETPWDAKDFAVEKLIYNFGCTQHFDDISNNWDCLVSFQTVQDFLSCSRSVGPQRGNCTEEAYAHAVDQISSCMKQSFTVRINNGADGCTQTASNIVTEFISEISGILHPCPGSHVQKRAVHKIDHAMWKKKIQSYFNFKF